MPRKKADPQIVEGLAAIGCTTEEMASVLRINRATLYRDIEKSETLRSAIERGRDAFKVEIRQCQRKRMQEGDTAMLIWLGKQYLGQRDYQRIESLVATVEAPGGQKIQVEYVNDVVPYQIASSETAHFAD